MDDYNDGSIEQNTVKKMQLSADVIVNETHRGLKPTPLDSPSMYEPVVEIYTCGLGFSEFVHVPLDHEDMNNALHQVILTTGGTLLAQYGSGNQHIQFAVYNALDENELPELCEKDDMTIQTLKSCGGDLVWCADWEDTLNFYDDWVGLE